MTPPEILTLARRLEGLAAGLVVLADDDGDDAREALGPTVAQLREGLGHLADALADDLDAAP